MLAFSTTEIPSVQCLLQQVPIREYLQSPLKSKFAFRYSSNHIFLPEYSRISVGYYGRFLFRL